MSQIPLIQSQPCSVGRDADILPPQGPPPPPYYVRNVTQIPREITVIVKPRLGMDSKLMVCPRCRACVRTDITSTPGMVTYLLSTLLCCFGCVLGCCLIPCCIDETQDTEHRCPRCRFYFGKHRQLRHN